MWNMLKILALAASSLAKLVCQMAANCWPTMTLLFHIFEWIPKIGQRLEEKLKPSLYSEFLKPELFLDIKIGLSREDMTVSESCFSWIPLGAKTAKLMFGPVREGVNGKKTFSFGHCPNSLTPPPLDDPNSGNLVLFFRKSKFKILKSV